MGISWKKLTDRNAALKALEEFDQLGREAFLQKYGFAPSTRYFVLHNDKAYDIKALAAATWGHAFPEEGAPANFMFSSGERVIGLFVRLGFQVVTKDELPEESPAPPPQPKTENKEESENLPAPSLEAINEPGVPGMHRIKLRILRAGEKDSVELGLRVPGRSEIKVLLKGANRAKLQEGRLRVPVGEEWAEVFFVLEGPSEEKMPMEVFCLAQPASVPPRRLNVLFSVKSAEVPRPEPKALASSAPGWAQEIPDKGARRVFLHLERHGSITEDEVVRMLGSPRKLRRFSNDLEEHQKKIPFRVRIELGTNGKRYVKEGEK